MAASHSARMECDPPQLSRAIRAFCTLCRSRCGAIYTISGDRMLAVAPDRDHPTGGALCAKGRAAPELAHHRDRLTRPLRRTNPKGAADPGWKEIGFEEALDEIAARMCGLRDAYGAESVAFAVTTPSGTGISDSLEWIQRLAWQFGSPNMVTSVEVCNFQKDYGQAFTFGQPLGTPDYARADTIVLWGHNPARTWLAQAHLIAEARRRGATVVVIDPKRSGSGEQADLWLRIRPGGDAALAMGAIRHMIETRQFAEDFVRDWTDAGLLIDRSTGERLKAAAFGHGEGFVAMRANGALLVIDPAQPPTTDAAIDLFFEGNVIDREGRVRACATALALLRNAADKWTSARVSETTGIPSADLAAFYELITASPRIAYYHWTGIAQNVHATQTTRAICSLFALRDDVDRAGGNRWYAAPATTQIADPTLLSDEHRAHALGIDDLPLGPPRHGYITVRDLCRSIEGNEPNRVRGLIGFGSNILVTHPDAQRTSRALEKIDFQVHCDLFMTPMAETADIILPVTSPWEHDALRIGFDISERGAGHIQFRAAMLPPPGEARPDYEIARGLGRRLEFDDALWHGPIETAFNRVLAPVGLDITALRAAPEGIAVGLRQVERRYAQPDEEGRPIGFGTPSRRIELYSEQMALLGYPPIADAPLLPPLDPAFPILLTTAKSGYFTHSALRNVTSLRRRSADPAIDISPALASRLGIAANDWVRVATTHGSVRMRARIDSDLSDDVVIAEYGWWQGSDALARDDLPVSGSDSASINAIIGDGTRDPVSGSPSLRQVQCAIARDDGRSIGNWSGDRTFVVRDTELIGGNVMRIVLEPLDGAALPAFLPGQHVGIAIAGFDGRRFYSLTSTGPSASNLEIAVRRSDGEEDPTVPSLSRHIHERLVSGSIAMLSAPTGSFVLPVATKRPVICVAGGIGITPFVSAFRAISAMGTTPEFTLHHIAASAQAAVFHHELAEIAAGQAGLSYTLWLRRGPLLPGGHVREGGDAMLIAAGIDDAMLARRPLVYVCGPQSLMDALRRTLVARGVPTSDIIAEAFKSSLAIPKAILPARIHLKRSGTSFMWTAEAGSLLSAATAAGLALPSGCQVGQCESCAVAVVSGKFLTSVATELGPEFCLTCQSIPIGDMTLDA